MEDVQKILMDIKGDLGGIRSDINTLKKDMTTICNFKDEVTERVTDLENETRETEEKLENHITSTQWIEDDAVRNTILLKSAIGAWSIFVAIMLVLWAIYKQLGITFTLG